MEEVYKKRKILIVSMTGGFGHVRAGQALLEYAKQDLVELEVEHIDLADQSPLLKKLTTTFYHAISKTFPFVWGALYSFTDNRVVSFALKSLAGINHFSNRKIQDYIYQKNPDGIIFTNVVPLPLFDADFHKKLEHVPMGVVVTDYYGHAYYNFPWLDYYFVPTLEVKNDLQHNGVLAKKIIVTGIPISPQFFVKENIKDLKLKYGIKNPLPVVVFIASFKASKKEVIWAVKNLLLFSPNINVIFIANGNKEFYNAVNDVFSGHERLFIVDWTNVIEQYLRLSDVVISKAGGLTVSECMSLQKPLIMVNPIPGQEEYNATFVQKNNFGKKVKNIREITTVLKDMLLLSKNNQMALLPKENPSKKILDLLIKGFRYEI